MVGNFLGTPINSDRPAKVNQNSGQWSVASDQYDPLTSNEPELSAKVNPNKAFTDH
jgi:hypothetical protein